MKNRTLLSKISKFIFIFIGICGFLISGCKSNNSYIKTTLYEDEYGDNDIVRESTYDKDTDEPIGPAMFYWADTSNITKIKKKTNEEFLRIFAEDLKIAYNERNPDSLISFSFPESLSLDPGSSLEFIEV